MSIRTWFCFPLAALALTAALPRADACSPPPPGLHATLPADGGKYPGNAAVILQGQGISLADAVVTVDGQPAKLTDVSKTRFSNLGVFAVVVEPSPVAGQKVVITGTFCSMGTICPTVTLHYEATAADTTPAGPIDLVGYNIHDYVDFKSSGGDCQSDSDFAWWVHFKSPIPVQATDGAVIYSVEGYPDTSLTGSPVVSAAGFLPASGDPVVSIRRTVSLLGGKALPEALCFRVKAFDTAGNAPVASEILCKPCNYRVDSTPFMGFPPSEPTWAPADIYPGGPCALSTTSTSGAGGGPPHGTTSSSSSTGASGSSAASASGSGSTSASGSGSTSASGSSSTGAGGAGGPDLGDDVAIDGCSCRAAGNERSPSGAVGALALAIGASLRLARRRRR